MSDKVALKSNTVENQDDERAKLKSPRLLLHKQGTRTFLIFSFQVDFNETSLKPRPLLPEHPCKAGAQQRLK